MPENNLVPELLVSSLEKSLQFYRDVLGFKVEFERQEDRFAYLSFYGSELMIEEYLEREDDTSPWVVGPVDYPKGRGVNIQIFCPSITELVKRLENAEVVIRRGVEECWYRDNEILHGQSNILVQDPDGFLLRFAEDLGKKPVEKS